MAYGGMGIEGRRGRRVGVGGHCLLVYVERSTTPCRLARLRDNEGIVMTRGMVYRVYSGTMIVTVYRYTGIQVYRVYKECAGSTVRYTGLQVYKESTNSIQAEFWREHC